MNIRFWQSFVVLGLALSQLEAAGLCVKAQKAFLRSGPGTKFEKTWTVGQYTPFREISSQSGWIKVKDVDGQTHWIHSSLVSYNLSCLTVRVPVATLRVGPGRRRGLAKYRQADKYTSFKKLDRVGRWFKIMDSKQETAWIYDSNVWRPIKSVSIEF